MTRTCSECFHFERNEKGDYKAGGRPGICALAAKRWDGEINVHSAAPACKGFEKKDQGQRPGKKYQGIRRKR